MKYGQWKVDEEVLARRVAIRQLLDEGVIKSRIVGTGVNKRTVYRLAETPIPSEDTAS